MTQLIAATVGVVRRTTLLQTPPSHPQTQPAHTPAANHLEAARLLRSRPANHRPGCGTAPSVAVLASRHRPKYRTANETHSLGSYVANADQSPSSSTVWPSLSDVDKNLQAEAPPTPAGGGVSLWFMNQLCLSL